MKKNKFINRNVLFTEFYLNYKLLLFIFIWCSFYSTFIIFTNLKKPYYIAPTISINNGKSYFNAGVLNGVSSYTASVISIISTSVFTIILVNVIICNQFSNGKLRLWLTSPYSKEQILYAKILFIWTAIFATFIIQFFCQLILCFISADLGKYIGLVIFKNISYFIFKLTVASVILLISSVLLNKPGLSMGVSIIFIICLIFSSIASSLFDLNNQYSWVKYLLFDNLSNADCLSFSNPTTPTNNGTLLIGQLIETKSWLKALTFIINITLVVGLTVASVKILKTKDAKYC